MKQEIMIHISKLINQQDDLLAKYLIPDPLHSYHCGYRNALLSLVGYVKGYKEQETDVINYKLQSLIDRINQRSKLHMSGSEIQGFFAAMVGEIISISRTVNQKPEELPFTSANLIKQSIARRQTQEAEGWPPSQILARAKPAQDLQIKVMQAAMDAMELPKSMLAEPLIWPELTPQDVWGTDKPLEGPL